MRATIAVSKVSLRPVGGGGRLFADVSLTAEPFFVRWGFVVEARQPVERSGVVLANARMGKVLAASCS